MPQMSIVPTAALSDLVLAVMCFASAFVLLNSKTGQRDACFLSAFGLSIIGAAASIGVVRFGCLPGLVNVHQLAALVASLLGMTAFAMGLSCAVSHGAVPPRAWIRTLASSGGAVALVSTIFTITAASRWNSKATELVCAACSGISLIVLLFVAFTLGQTAAVISVLCVLVGALFGGEGESWGVLNVNWFHYLLVTSIGFAVLQFLKKPAR